MREKIIRLLAGITTLGFVTSLAIGIAGGVLGNPILLGIGVGIASLITLTCICIRERNLAYN
jgi:hypothetical protein